MFQAIFIVSCVQESRGLPTLRFSTVLGIILNTYIYIIHLLQVKITETSERGALLGAKHVHQMNELELRPFSKNEKSIEHLTLS